MAVVAATLLSLTFALEPNKYVLMLGVLLSCTLGIVCAWTWWSFNVPRWRVWAYRRVDDITALKRTAISVGLIWPAGSWFEKTEIRSRALQAELDCLENKDNDSNT